MADKSADDVRFISRYIAKCGKEDLDIPETAKKEIAEIDVYLSDAENKKLLRRQLVLVLDHFGDDSYKRRRKSLTPTASEDVDIDTEEMDAIQEKLIQAVEDGKSFSIRDLIRSVGTYDKDALIIRCVKLLGDREIFLRSEDEKIIRGPKYPE